MTDADTISCTLCFSFMIVLRLTAATTTGGTSSVVLVTKTEMSFGHSTVTSNLHQLTCGNAKNHQHQYNATKNQAGAIRVSNNLIGYKTQPGM